MTTNLDFFNELKEWSERKLALIENYLASAAKILGSIDRVYYVDGFAGRGSYGLPNEPQVPGSPLRAAQLAHEYSSSGKHYSLRCINVEVDKDTFDQLQLTTQPFGHLVLNIHGSFVGSLDQILNEVGNKPVVCFLDPFGVDGMDWSAVQRLIQRKAQTDLWLRFDADEVRRRAGYYNNPQVGADKHFEILTRHYGINNKDALYARLDAETAEERKVKAVEFYMELLRAEFKAAKGDGYSRSYRIGSLQEDIKYYLVFATASKKGLTLASSVVYGIEENYQRELERHQSTGQTNMFAFIDPTEQEIFTAKVDALSSKIAKAYCGRKASRLDIHARVLDELFGTIKGPHITAALKKLMDNNYIVTSNGAISDDRTVFTFRAC